jgi:prepilin signal peptidase PulO-like enzyme (type II secretory pathway)
MTLVTVIFLAIFGWLTGAGINLLADQLPVERRISRPECPSCHKHFNWLQYLFLEACENCGEGRSARSFNAQWLICLAFVTILFWKPERILMIEALLLIAYFSLVLIIDIEHRLILHPVSFAGAVIGFFIGIRLHGVVPTLIGGIAGFAMMLLLYFLGELFGRIMAKRRGEPIDEVALGFGDVNLSGVLGLLLGWPGITVGLLVAILAGGLVSAFILARMMLRKEYQAFTALPYAPFLILAGVVLLFRP